MIVLYVGSGRSATRWSEFDGDVVKCAVNNAWLLFPSGKLDYWIYPGDFPLDRQPPASYSTTKIGYDNYKVAAPATCELAGIKTEFPHHWIGYTIFFQGLHWIMHHLKPSKIYTLGFDHDYNPKKVKKWSEQGCPGPHNRFHGDNPQNVVCWSESFFSGMEPDAFYGHGTPDPLRMPQTELVSFFDRSQMVANMLGIELFNLSNEKGLNTFQYADHIS